MNEKKFRFSIPGLSLQILGLSKLRLPLPGGLYLGGGKLIVGSLTTVALGFLASMFILVSSGDQEITWPMVGASYDAPSMVGSKVVDAEFPADISQTLEINMPAGIRIDVISFTNVSLGKFGITDAFQIKGTSTTDVITIDTLIIRNSEFPTMDWANGDIYTLHATSSVVAAGHTFSPTMSSSTNDVVIGSGRGATSYIAKDMVVDRIILQQTTSGGDVIIDTMILDGVRAWTGAFNADYFEIGRLILENVRIGDDGDINSADLILHSSVSVNTVYDGVVEEPIFIR
ncbi:MAG: hypothetical protein COC13_02720 [Methanobacteriota archaeon]|jgi:hypothetical protein|nr:MAG: hypothetical protein COC13_02720 [Euryarchaeota archaeon]